MKTLIRALAVLWSMVALCAFGQTLYPGPDQNIWLNCTKLLYGNVPPQALGTNPPAAGMTLLTDGTTLFWGGGPTNPVPQIFVTNLYSTFITNQILYSSNAFITNLSSLVINNVSNAYITNITVLDSLTVNTNVTVNNNITVKGNATLNTIIVTNNTLFTTNAFPLSAGSAWNFSKAYQFITTNNDFSITSITGVSNNLINWAVLEVSNSAAATHFCDLSSLPWHIVGTSSTNKVYIGSGKVAIISANLRGFSSSNIVTAVEQ